MKLESLQLAAKPHYIGGSFRVSPERRKKEE